MTVDHLINPANGVKLFQTMKSDRFQGKVMVQKKNLMNKAIKYQPGLVIRTDRSKVDFQMGAAVYLREKTMICKRKKRFFG